MSSSRTIEPSYSASTSLPEERLTGFVRNSRFRNASRLVPSSFSPPPPPPPGVDSHNGRPPPPCAPRFQRSHLRCLAAYSDFPVVNSTMLFTPRLPCTTSRIVKYHNRVFELWSFNSNQNPFFPGVCSDKFAPAVPPLSHRRYDGHVGRYDCLYSPQYRQTGRLHWPFIRHDYQVQPEDYAYAAFAPLTLHWVDHPSSTGHIAPEFIASLRVLLSKLEDQIAEVRNPAWTNPPSYVNEIRINELAQVSSWDEAVALGVAVQRGLREKEAWISCVHEHVRQADYQVENLNWVEAQHADEKYVGLWINGCSEEVVLRHLAARVPCFIIHEYPPGAETRPSAPVFDNFVEGTPIASLLSYSNPYETLAHRDRLPARIPKIDTDCANQIPPRYEAMSSSMYAESQLSPPAPALMPHNTTCPPREFQHLRVTPPPPSMDVGNLGKARAKAEVWRNTKGETRVDMELNEAFTEKEDHDMEVIVEQDDTMEIDGVLGTKFPTNIVVVDGLSPNMTVLEFHKAVTKTLVHAQVSPLCILSGKDQMWIRFESATHGQCARGHLRHLFPGHLVFHEPEDNYWDVEKWCQDHWIRQSEIMQDTATSVSAAALSEGTRSIKLSPQPQPRERLTAASPMARLAAGSVSQSRPALNEKVAAQKTKGPATVTCRRCSARARIQPGNTGQLEAEIEYQVLGNLTQQLTQQLEQSPYPWRVDENTNIPFCSPECNYCDTYKRHYPQCSADVNDDDTADSEVDDSEIDDDSDSAQDDGGSNSYQQRTLNKNIRSVVLLQSLKARLQNSGLFETGPAALGRSITPLAVKISDAQKEYGQAEKKVALLEQQIEAVQRQRNELLEKLQRLDPAYQHKRLAVRDPMMGEDSRSVVSSAMPPTMPGQSNKPPVELVNGKLPASTESPETLAQWIQLNRCSVKGVPHGPDWSVDLRDARGHQVLYRLVPLSKHSRNRKGLVSRAKAHFLAVLRLLVIPGAFAARTQRLVSESPPLSAIEWGLLENPDPDTVAQKLADHGLTSIVADDCWQFCYRFAKAHIQDRNTGRDEQQEMVKLVQEAEAAVSDGRVPPSC